MNRVLKILTVSVAVSCFAANAQNSEPIDGGVKYTTVSETVSETATGSPVRRLAFAWGADLAGNVDLSAHSMSAIGLSAEFGMRWRWIRFLGVGAAGNIMVNNSNRAYPIFLNFRTDFSNYRRLVFLDLRGGVSLNYFNGGGQETGVYASGGLGITLAAGHSFSSHIILSYTYLSQEKCYNGNYLRNCPGISMATLRLGVAF